VCSARVRVGRCHVHHTRRRTEWIPQRYLCDTPLSVSTWQNVRATRRTGRYGGACLKDGFGAPNWCNNTRSLALSRDCTRTPHTLRFISTCASRPRARPVHSRAAFRCPPRPPAQRYRDDTRWAARRTKTGLGKAQAAHAPASVAAPACRAGCATEATSLSYRPATASRIDTKR